MIRALDFTVEPDTTYRFRVRIVVYNPNLGREDVSPGVDTKTVELNGPWSEPTEEVTMPPDVATYALNREPNVPRKLDQVNVRGGALDARGRRDRRQAVPRRAGRDHRRGEQRRGPHHQRRRQEAREQEDRLQQPPARARRDGGRPADPAARAGHRRPALGPGAARWSFAATARSSSATRRTTCTTRFARTWPTTLPASSRRPKKKRRRRVAGAAPQVLRPRFHALNDFRLTGTEQRPPEHVTRRRTRHRVFAGAVVPFVIGASAPRPRWRPSAVPWHQRRLPTRSKKLSENRRSRLDPMGSSGYDTASSSPRSRSRPLESTPLELRKPLDSRVEAAAVLWGRGSCEGTRFTSPLGDTSETVAMDVGGCLR